MSATTASLYPGRPISTLMPESLGAYRIETLIGRGGIGSVYRATAGPGAAVAEGTRVAVKVLTKEDVPTSDRLRFAREASYLQALRHPGIVHIIDLDMEHERPYLVMEYLEGKPFDRLIKESTDPLAPEDAAELLAQAAEALHVAHLAGILHRDLKPGNLYLTATGQVKLLDFGLAQNTNTDSQMTATGAVLGTPAYMSPEQAGGLRDELTRRSDVYALGAVGYEMVAGQAPYVATNSMAILRQILEGPPTAVYRANPLLPPALATIIQHSMERFPEDRYRTAENLAADLRRFLRGQRIRAKHVGAWTTLRRGAWRYRRTIAIATAVALMLLSALIVGVKHVRQIIDEQRLQQEQGPKELAVTWEETFRHEGILDLSEALKFPLNKNMVMLDLEPTPGNLRLATTINLANDGEFQILFNDPDIGRGYALSMVADEGSIAITLSRGQSGPLASVAEQRVPALPQYPLLVQRTQDRIQVILDGEPIIDWRDLVPIEGDLNGGLYLAMTPQTTVADLSIAVTTSAFVSALEPADVLRQNGAFNAAKLQYEKFLRFFGDDPDRIAEVLAAEFRIGLCLHGLAVTGEDDKAEELSDEERERWQTALTQFLTIAANANAVRVGTSDAGENDSNDLDTFTAPIPPIDQQRYLGPALFYAWDCALRLGDFLQADAYFDRLRREFDLATVFATMPPELRSGLPRQYRDAGLTALQNSDIERAEKLLQTATELALLSGDKRIRAQINRDLAGMYIALNEPERGIELLEITSFSSTFPREERGSAMAHLARAYDHVGDIKKAEEMYQRVIAHAKKHKNNSLGRWNLIWTADFYRRHDYDYKKSEDIWKDLAKQRKERVGSIAHALLNRKPLKARGRAIEIATNHWFNAAIYRMQKNEKRMWEELERCAASALWWHMPVVDAKKLILQREADILAADQAALQAQSSTNNENTSLIEPRE